MKIGIDFDNTIVDYDAAFHAAARERGLVPDSVRADKVSVKRHLLERGAEEEWTRLQGYVYGPGIARAVPYEGAPEFFAEARGRGFTLVVVSHKTREPYLGPAYDLHAAALGWIREKGLEAWIEEVHLETTKESKLERIAAEGCDCFIDDLPEILLHPLFPASTRPILFAPGGIVEKREGLAAVTAWAQVPELLRAFAATVDP
jgi:hypothetical protein